MSSTHEFAIMSLHAGQKNYHEVCANYLLHSTIRQMTLERAHTVNIDIIACANFHKFNKTDNFM